MREADRVLSKCRDMDGDGDCYLCRTGYWLCPKTHDSQGEPLREPYRGVTDAVGPQ